MYPEKPWRLWVFILSNIEFGQLFTILGVSNRTQFLVKTYFPIGLCILCLLRVLDQILKMLGQIGKEDMVRKEVCQIRFVRDYVRFFSG